MTADEIVVVFHDRKGLSQVTKKLSFDVFYRQVLYPTGLVWYRLWMRSGGWMRLLDSDAVRSLYQFITNVPSPEWGFVTVYDATLNPSGSPSWALASSDGCLDGM